MSQGNPIHFLRMHDIFRLQWKFTVGDIVAPLDDNCLIDDLAVVNGVILTDIVSVADGVIVLSVEVCVVSLGVTSTA